MNTWRKNFQLLETATRKIGRYLKASAVIADKNFGVRVFNYDLCQLKFRLDDGGE